MAYELYLIKVMTIATYIVHGQRKELIYQAFSVPSMTIIFNPI